MSIKIYDAYKIKGLSVLELNEFLVKIKNKTKEKAMERFYKLAAKMLEDIIDGVAIDDYYKNYDNLQKRLLGIYTKTTPIMKQLDNKKIVNNDEILEHLSKMSIRYILDYCMNTEIKRSKIDNTIMSSHADFTNEIVLFPLNKNNILFQVFGQDIKNIMHDLCNSDNVEAQAFRSEYLLKDYHYQNSTDRPEDISAREWNKRIKDWEKVMPTFCAAKDGIVVNVTEGDWIVLDIPLFFQSEPIFQYVEPIEKRAKKLAYNRCRDEFYERYIQKHFKDKNISPSEAVNIFCTYKETILKEPEESKKIDAVEKELSQIMVDISAKSNILNAHFGNLLSNYAKEIK